MGFFLKYLIIINLISFIVSTICILAAKKKKNEFFAPFRTFISFVGGCVGNGIAFLLFHRKATKENMTLLVSTAASAVIYGVVLFAIYGPYQITAEDFFQNVVHVNKWFLIYLVLINVITFILFGVDKRKALKSRQRIPIVTLLGFSFAGGSVGGIIGMYTFRHKTKKTYFKAGMPMILLAQLVLVWCLISLGVL